jgi:hypothetical protein
VILVRFVRINAESIQPPTRFQAEYEGSIPFTRSIPEQFYQARPATY